tara:strand:- start:294 stop:680 length:387 start_codon:yes stop_codon:yes gene_type:complete
MFAFSEAWSLLKMGRRKDSVDINGRTYFTENSKVGQKVSNQSPGRQLQLPEEITESLNVLYPRLEALKQNDPEAYQKYLIQLSMGHRLTPSTPHPQDSIRYLMAQKDEHIMQRGLAHPEDYEYDEGDF